MASVHTSVPHDLCGSKDMAVLENPELPEPGSAQNRKPSTQHMEGGVASGQRQDPCPGQGSAAPGLGSVSATFT